MNIKNNVSLTIAEAVELLAKIADSLEQKHEFAFDLKGQEVSIEAGSVLDAHLSISPDEFSIIFNWKEESSNSEQIQDQTYESPQMIKEVNIPERKPQSPQIKVDALVQTQKVIRRALPDRMPLNTTTLPYDAGYWTPAFTSKDDAQWTKIDLNLELENKKWASEDQITTLSDLTPVSAQPKKRSRKKSNDDLFSELDELDEKPKSRSNASDAGVERVEIPQKSVASAAGIPKPGTSNIPSPSSSPSRSTIPSPSQTQAEAPATIGEAAPAASGDTWVKPSEVLKSKNQGHKAKPGISNIPSPSGSGSSNSRGIPIPNANSTPKNEEENLEWKEPSREDNVSDDEWIRPSEFLKKSKQKDKDDAVNRPPPSAPDSDS